MTSFAHLVKHWFSDAAVQTMVLLAAAVVYMIALVVLISGWTAEYRTPALIAAIVAGILAGIAINRKILKK